MILKWEESAWNEYVEWQSEDKKTLKRINALIKSIQRDGVSQGIGKPEKLKYQLSKLWSRRINEKDRLVYSVIEDELIIIQCKLHYGEN